MGALRINNVFPYHTRCQDAAYYAESMVNYFRCRMDPCPNGTTDGAPLDFLLDKTTGDAPSAVEL